jgi:hypothetical protein
MTAMSDRITLPSIKEAEKAIGLKTKAWAGQCYGIACLFVEKKLVPGLAVYGHWLGLVHANSPFATRGASPFQRHGWVKLVNGDVFDPTRWVFEAAKPYLFCGPNNNLYDEGGNAMRRALMGDPPRYRPTSKEFAITESVMDTKTWAFVEKKLYLNYDEQPVGKLTWDQLAWLANLPPTELAPFARQVFDALKALDKVALIPIDNLRMVERAT